MGSTACAVVIPAWNAERYVAEAIESVLGQTAAVGTVVVVDDGSTDGTADVVRSYPGVRLVQQEHAGAASARNRGVAECDEPVLAFLDADDTWAAGKLEHQLPRLAQSGVDAVFGLVENFLSPDRADVLGHIEFERRILPGFIPSALVLSRSTFEHVGPFAGGALADWVDWYLRLVDGGAGVDVVSEVVVRRRIHGDNQAMGTAADKAAYVRLVKASIDRRRTATPAAVPTTGR